MLNQKLQQKLQQKLSPQQIQVIKLLEIPAMMLEQRIKAEIEENPALEVEDDEYAADEADQPVAGDDAPDIVPDDQGDADSDTDADEALEERYEAEDYSLDEFFDEDEYSNYKYNTSNTSPDQENREVPFSVGSTLHEFLESQLGLHEISEHQRVLATYLLGNIDDDGYLRRELDNVADDIAFKLGITTTEPELEAILAIIHQLDPPGIGARDLQECLLLQIRRKDTRKNIMKIAEIVLAEFFTEFTRKHFDKIVNKLDIGEETLRLAIQEIVKLNPKPGSSFSDPLNKEGSSQAVIPDFVIEDVGGELELSLSSRNVPDLKVSRTYLEMLREYKGSKLKNNDKKEAVAFVKQKIESAKWFIDAMKQRQFTLLNTMQAIIDIQKEFFETGDETRIKPMILKDIADKTGLDVSTVSRVANSKYVQTHFGVFLLKYFFSEALQTEDGEEVSSREIKRTIQDLIAAENKKNPYTDDELADMLQEKGYIIARRTIAKYREQLNIPVGRMRKEI